MPMTTQDEFIAQLSEALLGYREGKPKDMLDKAKYLRELETVKALMDNKEHLVNLTEELSLTLNECGI